MHPHTVLNRLVYDSVTSRGYWASNCQGAVNGASSGAAVPVDSGSCISSGGLGGGFGGVYFRIRVSLRESRDKGSSELCTWTARGGLQFASSSSCQEAVHLDVIL